MHFLHYKIIWYVCFVDLCNISILCLYCELIQHVCLCYRFIHIILWLYTIYLLLLLDHTNCNTDSYNMSVQLWTHRTCLYCQLIQHVCFYSGLKYLFVLQTHRIHKSVLRFFLIAGSYNMSIWQVHTTYLYIA